MLLQLVYLLDTVLDRLFITVPSIYLSIHGVMQMSWNKGVDPYIQRLEMVLFIISLPCIIRGWDIRKCEFMISKA